MTRDDLLKPKPFEIKLPDGDTIHARKLKQSEFERIVKDYQGEEKLLDGLKFIVCRCALDDAGDRMFTDDEMGTVVNDLPADVIQTIGVTVMQKSGIKTGEAKGNG